MEEELRKVLRLRPGEDMPDSLRNALEEVRHGGYASLAEQLEALERELPLASNNPDDDKVWAAVEDFVDGKVGFPYQQDEQRKAEAEAERRRDTKAPPGFKDKGPGDYLIWSQSWRPVGDRRAPLRPAIIDFPASRHRTGASRAAMGSALVMIQAVVRIPAGHVRVSLGQVVERSVVRRRVGAAFSSPSGVIA